MKISKRSICQMIFVAVLTAPFVGCQNNTQRGAALGTAAGAGLGAIIGHQTGKGKEGALLGAAAGALGGGLLGKNQDLQEEKNAAWTHAAHSEMARQADAQALTNGDIINMSNKGLSDTLIINSLRSRGGRFQTDSSSLINLKQNGVSEGVIQAMLPYQSR